MIESIPIFVGYDPREAVAYHVCCESIIASSSMPVEFHPLALDNFRAFYEECHADGSNAFIYSRFLVPYLCGFKGHAIFVDGDMVVERDIAELWKMQRHDLGVQVVKHDYKTKHPKKYLGAKNEDYPRKNWSSVVLWNCGFYPNRCLRPEFVAKNSGAFLHRFAWLSDERIGELPAEWNRLVSEQDGDAALLHYTIGTPCFEGYENQDRADRWYRHLAGALNVAGQAPAFLLDNILHYGRS